MRKKDKRNRLQWRFWLDTTKPEQEELAYRLQDEIEKRKCQPIIRDALALFFSLRDNRIDLLKRLFPFLIERLREEVRYEMQSEKHEAIYTEFMLMLQQGRVLAPVEHEIPKLDTGISIFSEEKIDPSEARNNFASGMGNLFDDDEDLFDD